MAWPWQLRVPFSTSEGSLLWNCRDSHGDTFGTICLVWGLRLVCSLFKSFVVPFGCKLHLPWCYFSSPPFPWLAIKQSMKNCVFRSSFLPPPSLPSTNQVLQNTISFPRHSWIFSSLQKKRKEKKRKENGNSKIKEERTLWTKRDSRDAVMNVRTTWLYCLHSQLQVLEINRQAFMLKFCL